MDPRDGTTAQRIPEFPPLNLHPQFGAKHYGTTRQSREVTIIPALSKE